MFAASVCPTQVCQVCHTSVPYYLKPTNDYRRICTLVHLYTYFEKNKNKIKNYERNTI